MKVYLERTITWKCLQFVKIATDIKITWASIQANNKMIYSLKLAPWATPQETISQKKKKTQPQINQFAKRK